MTSTLSGIRLIAAGTLAIVGSALNWRFLNRRKLFNLLFGETLSRIIYVVLGILLFIMGIERLIGANWLRL